MFGEALENPFLPFRISGAEVTYEPKGADAAIWYWSSPLMNLFVCFGLFTGHDFLDRT